MFNFVFGLALVSAITSVTAEPLPSQEPPAPVIQQFTSTTSIASYVKQEALKQGVDVNLVEALVNCESAFVPQQSHWPSKTGPNGREDSWGIFQIHLPSHKDITREQAMDVVWSTEWSLDKIKNKTDHWSCQK